MATLKSDGNQDGWKHSLEMPFCLLDIIGGI